MLVAVGLNQKGATVADRERLAVRAEEMGEVLGAFAALDGVDELVLLATCYRIEAYAATRSPAAASAALRRAFTRRAGAEVPLFELEGEDALRHLMRVAASLESAIVGEPQILGQVKEAHQRAAAASTCGRELGGVFHRVFEAAKRVRSDTAIGRSGVSWGNAAATVAEKVLGSVAGRRVLVLGAGEMARLSAQHLREQGAAVVVVNRTLANAEALAAEVGGTAVAMEALEAELLRADMVVSAAPAAPPAFEAAALAATMKARQRRDLVMVDLAMPRAIPAAAGELDGVYLCDVDDLARLTERALAERAQAVADAEAILAAELARFRRDQAERKAAPVIQAMRQRASAIAREEVDRTVKRLGADDPDLQRKLDAMANAVVAKLLHAPSTRLRQAGAEQAGGDRLILAAIEIFGLPLDGAPPAAR